MSEIKIPPITTPPITTPPITTPPINLKIVLLGDEGVGKSTFLFAASDSAIINDLHPTIGLDFKHMTFSVDEVPIKVKLFDIASRQSFQELDVCKNQGQQLMTLGCADADIFMFVVDATKSSSFKNINNHIASAYKYSTKPFVGVLLITNHIENIYDDEINKLTKRVTDIVNGDNRRIMKNNGGQCIVINQPRLNENNMCDARNIVFKLTKNLLGDSNCETLKYDTEKNNTTKNESKTINIINGKLDENIVRAITSVQELSYDSSNKCEKIEKTVEIMQDELIAVRKDIKSLLIKINNANFDNYICLGIFITFTFVEFYIKMFM